ncbi:MAG TPA: hypothetical protein VJT09_00745 [Pyrinomonadaceae bacterium]|nr:hypothetical protein [Pyrinomonadaceae bacterium]
MRSSTASIKALSSRFASLPPAVRMQLTKRLLDSGTTDQALGQAVKKSFLERFWEEVEEAYGDHSQSVNPFAPGKKERGSSLRRVKAANEGDDEQGGFFPWGMRQLNWLARS